MPIRHLFVKQKIHTFGVSESKRKGEKARPPGIFHAVGVLLHPHERKAPNSFRLEETLWGKVAVESSLW
jgi:hypothetical protein